MTKVSKIGIALMNYIKSKHTVLFAKSKFGPDIGIFVRQLQIHTSAFDEQYMNNVHKSVTLTVHLNTGRNSPSKVIMLELMVRFIEQWFHLNDLIVISGSD